MKMTISKTELQNILEDVNSVISKKSVLDIIKTAKISFKEIEDTVYIFATGTDLETMITSGTLISDITDYKDFCVDIHTLLPLLKNISEQPITIEIDNVLKVFTSNGVFDIAILDAFDFPKDVEIKDYKEYVLNNDILSSIVQAAEISAKDELRPIISAVLLNINAGNLNIVATDAHGLTVSKYILENASDNKIILPTNAVKTIKNLIGKFDTVTLKVSNRNIILTKGSIKYTIRMIEGNYPNYEAIIPSINSMNTQIFVDVNELEKALNRVQLVSKNIIVVLETNNMFLSIETTNMDMGIRGKETIPAVITGNSIKIGFNVNILKSLLKLLGKEKITFHMNTHNTAALITSESNSNQLCLIMPVQI